MIDAASAPLPVPLSVDRHGMRRWRRFADYGWARARRMVPVVLAEAEAVAASLPLVFAQGTPETDAAPHPVALLRLGGAETPFVDARGQWLAAYVPALLRVHPFSAQAAGDDPARMILLVDESGGFVTDDVRDARFFDPFGTPDPALQAVVDFFRQYELSARATRTACAALADAGLFAPLDPGDPACAGLFGLDRARLRALDDAAFLRLRGAGALDLAQAHFVGRMQLDFLRRAEAALAAGAGQAAGPLARDGGNTPAQAGAGMSDFLAALAAAQDDGLQGFAGTGPGQGEGRTGARGGPDGDKGQT